MKKLLLLSFAALAALSLTACSNKSETKNPSSSSSNSSETKSSSSTSSSSSSSSETKKSSSSEKAKSSWTQEIYDSIQVATTGVGADGSITYSGGTPYADIEAKVGKPTTTSESSVGNQTTVMVNWTSISWTGGKNESVSIFYDKTSGQITNKSKISA